jgi:hypothetical protein
MTRSSQQTYIQRLGFQDKDRANPRHGLACEYLLERLVEKNCIARIQDEVLNALAYERNRIVDSKAPIADRLASASRYGEESDWAKKTIIESNRLIEECDQKIACIDSVANANQINLESLISKARGDIAPSDYINVPITSGKFVNGFADVLFRSAPLINAYVEPTDDLSMDLRLYLPIEIVKRERGGTLGEVKITPEPAENIVQQIAFYRTFVDVSEVIVLVDYDAPQLKRMTAGSDIHVYRLGAAFERWCANRPQPEIEEF